ncbi:hypothetical protein BU23DRAFT_118180 [Bimuria novae-zelandiae CBS 107.79]|uniref:CCHC-type domain-containing protein n=1 Tax=Bimuria novae-zelandiae CBS 107.79 TaxID=1447943 RepID=A0A6A5VCR0_9PLEO|nr:hypothetical protein BU23DRAFT_118180 [Bimuria novae-zelandiae CBS 107.79]
MARGFDLASNSIGANPYPKPKEVVPEFTACEVCKRTIPTKNWSEHKGSKKHRKAEDEERRGKDKENFASYGGVDGVTSIDGADHWGGGGGDTWATNETDSGGAVQGGGSGRACYGCGEEGHQKRDCPKSSGGGGRACYGCGEEGHQKRDCPQSASGSGGDSRACFNCGMTGHRKADCPNGAQSAENGSGNGGQQCFNCYEYGHRKSECTKERVMKCRNCEEIGHMSRDWYVSTPHHTP